MNELLSCPHAQICPACTLIALSYQQQQANKLLHLKTLWKTHHTKPAPPIKFHSIGLGYHRDYMDLAFLNGQYGFYKNKQLIPISQCLLLNSSTQELLDKIRSIKFPVSPISLRIRHTLNQPGLWIDTANIFIKNLLDEKITLQKIIDLGFSIEMGQKNKYLNSQSFKLEEGRFVPLMKTYLTPTQTISLYGFISSFTQSGFLAVQKICEILFSYLQEIQCQNIAEFGSGIGTLTYPLLGENRFVTACEIDESSCSALKHSLKMNSEWDLSSRVHFIIGDHQNKKLLDLKNYDTIVVNPPRAGVKKFLHSLQSREKTKNFIYMSCFPKSFIEDSLVLHQLGFNCTRLDIVDQFPQTDHYEVLSLWE